MRGVLPVLLVAAAAATFALAANRKQPPTASPLISAWTNVQQLMQQQQQLLHNQKQQQINESSQQLAKGQQQQSNQIDQLLSTSVAQSAAVTTRAPGDVNEALATDFPNPNINNAGHEITKILKKFFLHGYDKRVRPNYSGPPALVNVSFHIIGISSVSEVQMDFTVDFYFRQRWFDPRLEFTPVVGIKELCVGAEFAEKIWLPDTFFANEKTATFHKATTENTFIRVGSNGLVYRSIRLTVTCSCPMDLQYFPMDRQRCKIEIESYGYNTRDIDYQWNNGNESVSLDTKIELPQFKILGFKMGHELQSLSSGDYIRLYCEIHFVRSMGYYLIQIYIPASLIVIISWVSFWLHRNATPARVALGVTTVLTMTTLMSSTNAALPKISYIKSIDVFLGTCFVMVFASLLEYASVGYIGKRIAMKRKRILDLRAMQAQHKKICVAAAAAVAATTAGATQQQANDLIGVNSPESNQTINRLKPSKKQQYSKSAASFGLGATTTCLPHQSSQQPQRPSQFPLQHLRQVQLQLQSLGSKDSLALVRPAPASLPPLSGEFEAPPAPHAQPATPAAPSAAPAAATLHTHLNQQQDGKEKEEVINICGLTPSAIDKYSRVVFPICFVCFNLMYWIVYGHISQQMDSGGPPLIPFIRS